jgi:hypothetical protein
MEIRIEEEKAIQATRATNEHKNSLSQVTKWLSWFWDLKRIWSLDCVLEWMILLLYWIGTSENLDAIEGGGWGGIYSLQPLPSRWLFLLAMGTLDSPVRAMSARPLGFGATWPLEPLSCSCTGQSSATPDMSGALWLLCSDFWRALFTSLFTFCSRPLCLVIVAPLAHRTCLVHTGQCGEL